MEENPESKKSEKLNAGVTRRDFLLGFAGALTKAVTQKVPTMEKVTTSGASADPRLLEPFEFLTPSEKKINTLAGLLENFDTEISDDVKVSIFESYYHSNEDSFPDIYTIKEIKGFIDGLGESSVNYGITSGKKIKSNLDILLSEFNLDDNSTFLDLKQAILKKQLSFLQNLNIDQVLKDGVVKNKRYVKEKIKSQKKFCLDELERLEDLKPDSNRYEEENKNKDLIGDYRDLENLQPGYGGGHNIKISDNL